MNDLLRQRVQERLDALNINPFEAARRANFERSFVNDLLIGKKSTVRQAKISALAQALECDPEYLSGLQGVPRSGDMQGTLRLAGIIEANTWRQASAFRPPDAGIPLSPDPRYPANFQEAYLVRGDHFASSGVSDGSIVLVYSGPISLREGDVVVARRKRSEDEIELSIRSVAAGALSARPLAGTEKPIPLDKADIVGLVLSSHRVFGPSS